MLRIFANGFLQDKQKGWNARLLCPYMLCDSNQPFRGARKPKMKYVQKISPTTYQFKCKYCGCLTNVSLENHGDISRAAHVKNPSLINGLPSYNLWGR